MNLSVMDVEKEHPGGVVDKVGLNLCPGMKDLIRTAFKLLAPVNVLLISL